MRKSCYSRCFCCDDSNDGDRGTTLARSLNPTRNDGNIDTKEPDAIIIVSIKKLGVETPKKTMGDKKTEIWRKVEKSKARKSMIDLKEVVEHVLDVGIARSNLDCEN